MIIQGCVQVVLSCLLSTWPDLTRWSVGHLSFLTKLCVRIWIFSGMMQQDDNMLLRSSDISGHPDKTLRWGFRYFLVWCNQWWYLRSSDVSGHPDFLLQTTVDDRTSARVAFLSTWAWALGYPLPDQSSWSMLMMLMTLMTLTLTCSQWLCWRWWAYPAANPAGVCCWSWWWQWLWWQCWWF